MLFEQPDRVFVDRCASDADARRRAEEIEEALAPIPAAAAARQERGRFVAALVSGEAEVRQGRYLLARAEDFLTLVVLPVLRGPAAGFRCASALAVRDPLVLAPRDPLSRWTSVNRV